MSHHVDVAIIGSGFSGAILAWILARQGMRVALIDAATHPRFAIGESSTPIADTILRRLGQQFELPELCSLSTWGQWQNNHRELACGLKRGFSYFFHRKGQPFLESKPGERSLLVSASPDDEVADTHWYRPDVDTYLWRQAVAAGALDLTGYEVGAIEPTSDALWALECGQPSPAKVFTEWVIDASGRSSVLAQRTNAPSLVDRLQTRSRSTFAHFRGVATWRSISQRKGLDQSRDPFDPDDAAQHHLVGDGWVWMLRFGNGITSVGYTCGADQPSRSPQAVARDFPALAELLRNASLVAPEGGLRSGGRLQSWFDPVVDARRIMLPTAALTLDPLHSTGIAHALAGVQRLTAIITCNSHGEQKELIEGYRRFFLEETEFLDTLVSTAYRAMDDFDRFTAACMLYFAGAIRCEERYQRGDVPTHLWNADDPDFVEFVNWAATKLRVGGKEALEEIRVAIAPWNTAGLMNPSCGNRYAYTATKQSFD
jgi:FADH2 O2-dependent halogenase